MGNSNMGEAGSSGSQFSLGGMLGAGAGTAFRMLRGTLRGKPGRNQKLLRGVQAGVSGFAKPLGNVLRILFLEVSGVFFLFFSLAIVSAVVREYRRYEMHEVGPGGVVLAGAVGAMFLYFGLSSFWRARRKRSKV